MKVVEACTFSRFGRMFFDGTGYEGELALLRWISGDQSSVGGDRRPCCKTRSSEHNTTRFTFLAVRLARDYDNNIYWWDP